MNSTVKVPSVMDRVNAEVAQLWQGQEHHLPYTRNRIKRYINNWAYELETTETLYSMHCAEIRGEIIGAVRTMRIPIRWYFQLHCLYGYDFEEICRCLRWSDKTCERRHRDLINGLCSRLCNDTERVIVDSVTPRAIYEDAGLCCVTGMLMGKPAS